MPHNEPTNGERVLLSVREVSARLGLSERQLWHMAAAGLMPRPVPVARRLKRWRSAEISDWVREGCPPVCDGWRWPSKEAVP